MKTIVEGRTKIFAFMQEVVDKKMPIFYNPVMVLNRDFSLLVLAALNRFDLDIADPLAGTGIRSLRMLNELDEKIIRKICVNDIKFNFVDIFEKNLSLNKDLDVSKLDITNMDANKVLNNNFFDYVEIDPFGSPNPYLDSAIRSIRKGGVLSVTATDTSALCGSYSAACFRKYWAKPLRDETMHEFGLRILIRKIQLIGAQHEKALIPLVSFAHDHYMKVFFKVIKNKTKVDEVLKKHDFYVKNNKVYGPIWLGRLCDKSFLETMFFKAKDLLVGERTLKLLNLLIQENQEEFFLLFDVHKLSSELNLDSVPKHEKIMGELISLGFGVSKTHFSKTSIKTDASRSVLLSIMERISKNDFTQ